MKYFKNTELAKLYHVSEKTVRNWIDAAQASKLDLQLHTENSKMYIANSSKNTVMIEGLVEKGRKYKNTRGYKVVTPSPQFYELFNQRQVLDIISNLDIHREIPRQYNYMDGGAHNWDAFIQRLQKEEAPNILSNTVSLLHDSTSAIDRLLEGYQRVNIIDLGVGNALPVKEFAGHLIDKGTLNRYIAIDISPEMLQIAKQNFKKWFGNKINLECYARDFTYERFDDLLVDDMLGKEAEDTVNLVLLLGGTLVNFRKPYDVLRTIYSNLGRRDLIIHTGKTDSEAARRYFDFSSQPGVTGLSPNHRFIFDLLNIDESFYDVEMGYDELQRERYIRIRLKVALTIKLGYNGIERNIDLNKGEAILLWRARHHSALEIINRFENTGMTLLQASATKNRQYLLTIYGVNAEPSSP